MDIVVKQEALEEVSDSIRGEMDMYRRLGVVKLYRIETRENEDPEAKWLQAITWEDSDTVYVCDPANEPKS